MTEHWFRWYRVSIDDGKMRVTARYANVTLRDVIAVWVVLLEEASHPDHRGVCEKDEDYIGVLLDIGAAEVAAVLAAMERQRMIEVGAGAITITNWAKRQFESDIRDPTAPERMRNHRARKRKRDDPNTGGDSAVTAPLRDVTASFDPETETETEKNVTRSARNAAPGVPAEAGPAAAARPLVEVLFGECLAYLKASGVADKQARTLIGKWRSAYGDGEVAAAIGQAQRDAASEPVGLVTAILQRRHETRARDAPRSRHPYAPAATASGMMALFAEEERRAAENGRGHPPGDDEPLAALLPPAQSH